jgi:hypothetical protein
MRKLANVDIALFFSMLVMNICPDQNVLWCHLDIDVLRINAWRRELKPILVVLLGEFDGWSPYQLLFGLHPILGVFAEKTAIRCENVISAPHDAVAHPFDFVENGFALSNWN